MRLFRRKKKPGKRIHIRGDLTVDGFIEQLHTDGVRYVNLRWWKQFPHLDDGEDIDILVANEDYEQVDKLLVADKSGVRCDAYLAVGKGGNQQTKTAYFPEKLALDTLENRVLFNDTVYVPAPQQYFATLAFHAVFHKGYGSGVPGFDNPAEKSVGTDHDYIAELSDAAEDAGITIEITAGSLKLWLENRGYAPPFDMLGKLLLKSPELAGLYDFPTPDIIQSKGELCLFVVRELGQNEQGFVEDCVSELEYRKLEIMRTIRLTEEQSIALSRFRGGDWGKGPFARSGGNPAAIIIAYDWYPDVDSPSSEHPLMFNSRLRAVKTALRDRFNAERNKEEQANPVHAVDNEAEAFEYLESLNPDLAIEVRKWGGIRRDLLENAPAEDIEILQNGRRARTSFANWNGDRVVKKVYRPGCEDSLERELFAREMFSASIPMPQILHSGPNFCLMEYVADAYDADDNSLDPASRSELSLKIIGYIHRLWTEGYFQPDLTPENILIKPDNSLCILDWEFLQPYGDWKPEFQNAFEFVGTSWLKKDAVVPITRRNDQNVPQLEGLFTRKRWRNYNFQAALSDYMDGQRA